MVYTDLTLKAMKIAYDAHHGQLDKGGSPYIFHPIHLAEQMEDEVSCCAALLHDVVEDTSVTMEELEMQFPQDIITVLRLLTHEEGVPYEDYVRQIRGNPVAMKIKLADIAHNSDQSRLSCCGISEDGKAALRSKYTKATAVLLE